MLASLMGHDQVVPILLEAGANPFIRDTHGLTALEWAQRRGFQQVIELLGGVQSSSDPTSYPASNVNATTPHRLRPQEFGPASMAVLKTVHASQEAERQKAGVATQMAPESGSGNPPQSQEASEISPELRSASDRERLFSAGLKKLQAQTRAKIDPSVGPPVQPAVETTAVDEPTSVDSTSVDFLLNENDFATAPLVSMLSSEEEKASPAEDVSNSDTTAWSSPVLEAESQESDEETVVAAEPVVVPPQDIPVEPRADMPVPPKGSFLQYPILDVHAEPARPAPSVIRPVLWVLILFALIGSVYLTYVLTNKFMNRGATTASNAPATTAPPPAQAAPPGTPVKVPSKFPLTAGALADAESNLPDAEYPAQAKSNGVSGIVTVVVRVKRADGAVVSARALNGDKQLQAAAEKAAKEAKFSTAKLADEGKVVGGTISYRFGDAPVPNTEVTDGDSPVLGGALAGTAVSVPKPEYPEGAKSGSGSVMVVARVNRYGEVIAAHALNGDSILRRAAESAARKAKFSREKLPTETRVTSGTITYNFKPSATAPGASAAVVPAPTPVTATEPVKQPNDVPVVGGDLAGKQKNIPKAEYPAEARRKGISGKVTVLVRVNRNGQVISWRTLEGDEVLRSAALKAARKATFAREKLGKTDTLGTITYNFQP